MSKKTGIIKNSYSLSHRASSLRLVSRSIANALHVGNFRSMYKGRGVDYAGAREYLYGDDIRAIDWNVTARMGKPYIKLFEEDKELIVFVIVDRSASMESGSGKRSRLELASETAVLMIFAAMQNASPVGGILFNGELEFSSIPKTGKDHAMVLFSKIDTPPIHNTKGSSLSLSLRYASRLLKNRSLVLILSDFRCGGYEKDIAALASKHDVVAVRIHDETDSALPNVGTVEFFDPETQTKKPFATSNLAFQKEWKSYNERHFERWHAMCTKRGIDTLTLSTNDDPVQDLAQFFSSRRFK